MHHKPNGTSRARTSQPPDPHRPINWPSNRLTARPSCRTAAFLTFRTSQRPTDWSAHQEAQSVPERRHSEAVDVSDPNPQRSTAQNVDDGKGAPMEASSVRLRRSSVRVSHRCDALWHYNPKARAEAHEAGGESTPPRRGRLSRHPDTGATPSLNAKSGEAGVRKGTAGPVPSVSLWKQRSALRWSALLCPALFGECRDISSFAVVRGPATRSKAL